MEAPRVVKKNTVPVYSHLEFGKYDTNCLVQGKSGQCVMLSYRDAQGGEPVRQVHLWASHPLPEVPSIKNPRQGPGFDSDPTGHPWRRPLL